MELKLERNGKFRTGHCPYCNSGAATLVVADDDTYRCMSCGKGGILGAKEADEPAKTGGHRLYRINEAACRLFQMFLKKEIGKEGREYFEKRALTPETIQKFRLGYAGKKGVDAILKRAGFTEEELIDSGLFKRNEDGSLWYQLYGRVTYPITDAMGLVIGFGGRVLDDTEPKYKNSPETEIFTKRENLYAWEYASESKKKHLILCEGYMDVISMHQAGFDNAVASLGTALTEEQAKKMKSVTDYCIILYDTDEPGRKATLRAIEILKKAGIRPYVSDTLPAKDPDEYLKKFGAAALKERLKKCQPEQEYRILLACQNEEKDYEKICDILLEDGADVPKLVRAMNRKKKEA